MLKNLKINTAAFLAAGLGAVGLALRILLYGIGVDEKGLLVSGHPVTYLTAAVALAAGVLVLLWCRASTGSDRSSKNFLASAPGGVGGFIAAAGVLVTVLLELGDDPTLPGTLCTVAGFLSVVSFLMTGLCRLKGQRPLSVYHGMICLYFALRMVCRYRVWSANPQLCDYIFQLLTCLCLMLLAYHRTAFDAGVGKRKPYLFFSLMTVVFSIMALYPSDALFLELTCGTWAFTNVLQPRTKEA